VFNESSGDNPEDEVEEKEAEMMDPVDLKIRIKECVRS
jgi:hypothetical protein